MLVHIDLPIFSSPTEPFGWFSGDIDVASFPAEGAAFPWPAAWLSRFSELFAEQSHQVWGISEWAHGDSSQHITMYGLVVEGRDQAALLAQHIECMSGIVFSEHDLPETD